MRTAPILTGKPNMASRPGLTADGANASQRGRVGSARSAGDHHPALPVGLDGRTLAQRELEIIEMGGDRVGGAQRTSGEVVREQHDAGAARAGEFGRELAEVERAGRLSPHRRRDAPEWRPGAPSPLSRRSGQLGPGRESYASEVGSSAAFRMRDETLNEDRIQRVRPRLRSARIPPYSAAIRRSHACRPATPWTCGPRRCTVAREPDGADPQGCISVGGTSLQTPVTLDSTEDGPDGRPTRNRSARRVSVARPPPPHRAGPTTGRRRPGPDRFEPPIPPCSVPHPAVGPRTTGCPPADGATIH